MIKVDDLQVGDRVMFNKVCPVYVRELKADRVMVSKQQDGMALFSIPTTSANFEDLRNRVELA